MSRHNGADNQWAMSPSPTRPGAPPRGSMPIKKESWRPAPGQAQSSWTPTEPRSRGPVRQEYDQGPSSAPRGRGDPPPSGPGRSGGDFDRQGSRGDVGRRVEEKPQPRDVRGNDKGKEERSWSAWNRKTGVSGDARGAPERGREDESRWRPDDEGLRRREAEGSDKRASGNSYRPPEAPGQRRPWGGQERPSLGPPPPPPGRDTRDREPPSRDGGRRASPDYGVGASERSIEREKRARSRSRERQRSPVSHRTSSPSRSSRARSPPSLPTPKRVREHSPSSSSTTSPRRRDHHRNYSSTSSSRSTSPHRRSQNHYPSQPSRPDPSPSTHRRRSPSPPPRAPPPPRRPISPHLQARHPPDTRPPPPPPRGPRQMSPPRGWGRPPLPDQGAVFANGLPPSHPHTHSQPPPPPPIDNAPGRQTWANRRDRWAEGVARGQEEHPHPQNGRDEPSRPPPDVRPPPQSQPPPPTAPASKWPSATNPNSYRPEPRRAPSPPRVPPPQPHPPPAQPNPPVASNGYTPLRTDPPPQPRSMGIKIDLSLAKAPISKSAVQHLFDDSNPSTPTTTGQHSSPHSNGHPPPPPSASHPPPPPTPTSLPTPAAIAPPPALPPFPPTHPPPPPSPLPEMERIIAHQRSYIEHLNTIAPYIKAAFSEWRDQGNTPSLPEFLVHYFGRPPTHSEVEQVQQLSDRARNLEEDQSKIPSLDKQRREELDREAPSAAMNGADTAVPSVPAPAASQVAEVKSQLPPGEVYERLACVGEGTYGKVYKAKNVESGTFVAMKRIRMEGEKDGFPVTAMREIKLLQGLKHDNVIGLVEMMVSKGSVYMIFEYMEHDLTGLLAHPDVKFTPANLKSLNYQMLDGLAYLHDRSILHRDLKGSNILLDGRGVLKLADFGLARFYSKKRRDDYTNRVITLWYRSPELLLGETVYGPEVDIWSAGCIMLELFVTKPIFQGNDEISQLETIYALLGTPSPESWPSLLELPWYELVRPKVALPDKFRDSFKKWLSPAALDLAVGLLTYDPAKRLSAREALGGAYFLEEEPGMERPDQLGRYGEQHEMDAKANRRKKRDSAAEDGR